MKIGNILKLIRTNKSITQKEMAEKLKISQNYLSLIESNKKNPSNDKIAEFAKLFNISKEALFFVSSEVPTEFSLEDKIEVSKIATKYNISSFI